MKRSVTILLAFLYITLTGGFSVNVHYCMGKLASLDFTSHQNDTCNKCGKPGKKNSCCRDEYKFCKVDVSSHVVAKVHQSTEPAVKDLNLPVIIMSAPELPVTHFTAYYHHGPPDRASVPLYIRYCTYLI